VSIEDVAIRVFNAKTARDLLGPDDEERKNREKELKRLIHPDRYFGTQAEIATKAFSILEELLYEEKRTKSSRFDVTTRARTYEASGTAYKGTVGNLYACRYVRGDEVKEGLLKLPRAVRDSDLISAEARSLKAIWESKNTANVFFPRFEETFKHRDQATKIDRQALVVRRIPDFISLAEVAKSFPAGLEIRDLAWIWRRCLVALTLLSELEIVHGSVIPEHILIKPDTHSVMLTGMTTSVRSEEIIKVLGGDKKFYPPEVLNKECASTATDIYMLCATMNALMRADTPKQFRLFVKGCTFERPKVRPQNPLMLLDEFDELLERMYGPRRFRVFPNIGVA
jgi:hypothetical protein